MKKDMNNDAKTPMKKIVIMGGTSGIGLNVAERLAADGLMVGVAGRKVEVMKDLAARYPQNVVWEVVDVNSPKAVEGLHTLIQKLGGMDVYFHVAGIGYDNDSLLPDLEMATMQTNVVGFTRMVGEAYRYFRDVCKGYGQIAAITSVAGTNGIGRLAAYSASKKFQQTYLRALNQLSTIEKLHIKFTDIRPGWIRTPLLDVDHNYPLCMTLPYAVPRVISAIKRRKRVAVVDWRWNIVVGLWRLIPNWLWVRLPVPVDSMAKPSQVARNSAEALTGEFPGTVKLKK